jgi:hypothetical protein
MPRLAIQGLEPEHPTVPPALVSRDIAVVVLIMWTLTARNGFEEDATSEGGIDVCRHQPDGRWPIFSMATFTMRPNKLVDDRFDTSAPHEFGQHRRKRPCARSN